MKALEMKSTLNGRVTSPALSRVHSGPTLDLEHVGFVQRTCACGGGCPSCQAKHHNNESQLSQYPLSFSPAGNSLELEADAIADQVVSLHRNNTTSHQTVSSISPSPRAEPLLAQSTGSAVAANLTLRPQTSKGSGHSLRKDTSGSMERSFGAEFGNVRLHTDAHAQRMCDDIAALAFTFGPNIYFNLGQYQPDTPAGTHLLAHELTHVLQHRAGTPQISRVPNPAPPPDPYLEGRPAHNHPALGIWPAVQANARLHCARETTILPAGPLVIPIPPSSLRGRAECACAFMTPLQVLGLARTIEMHNQPLAIRHLNHYLSGGGADFIEHINLDNLMKSDAGARGVVSSDIASADRGSVFIQQSDYSNEDFLLAFGGIDRVDYQVNRSAGTVDIWFKDRYDFHPAGFGHLNMGTGDYAPPGRETNCVHLAAVEAKSSGAADYWMIGHATLPLSLFTSPASVPTPRSTGRTESI